MNDDRRASLRHLSKRIQEMSGTVTDLKDLLEELKEAEEDYLNAMPDSFANGAPGEKAQAAVDALVEALSPLETFMDEIDTVTDKIEEACA